MNFVSTSFEIDHFRPKFILQPGKIYEIVHYPSVGASTVALNIGLDYIIKLFIEAELPEIIPGTGFSNAARTVISSS